MILHPIYSGIKLNWFTEVCLPEACLCSCSCVAYKTFCHPSCLLPLSDWLSTGQEGKGSLHAYIHEHVHMRKNYLSVVKRLCKSRNQTVFMCDSHAVTHWYIYEAYIFMCCGCILFSIHNNKSFLIYEESINYYYTLQ